MSIQNVGYIEKEAQEQPFPSYFISTAYFPTNIHKTSDLLILIHCLDADVSA